MNSTPREREILDALADCTRTPGWNMRRREIRRFTVGGKYGAPCTLICVPAAFWVFHRAQAQADAWQREQGAA